MMSEQVQAPLDQETEDFPSSKEETPRPQPIDLLSFGKVNHLQNVEEEHPYHEQLLEVALQNEMKSKALEKAGKMIQLLEEERKELQDKVIELKQQIGFKISIIQELQKKVASFTENKRSNTEGSGPKMENISGSKLFFSFAQLRHHTPPTQAKTFEMSSLKLKPELNISEELPAWQSPCALLGQLKQTISGQFQEDNTMRDLEEVVRREQMQSQLMKWSMDERLNQIEDLIESDVPLSFADSSFKSSSTLTERSDSPSDSTQMFQQYEQLLLNYQSYSAYLKAYLCQALNCLAKLKDTLTASKDIIQIVPLLCRQIRKTKARELELFSDNKQLQNIVEGFIRNLTILERGQHSRKKAKSDIIFQ